MGHDKESNNKIIISEKNTQVLRLLLQRLHVMFISSALLF